MYSHVRVVIGSIVGISILMIFVLGFHLGGPGVLKVGLYSPLLGAFIGGTVALLATNIFPLPGERGTFWVKNERLAWTFIGIGCICWAIGECYWRYLSAQGQNPFPSFADLGYATFPPFVFVGLLLQPFPGTGRRRVLILLDSLIAMGSLLAIAWFLLLGSLAQAPGEATFAKFLGLYYPTADIALLSCLLFLLIRGQGRLYRTPVHRISLLILGLGLSIFAISDFFFNIQQNAGTYVDGTWADLGWPLGIMAIGVAAYLRRFLTSSAQNDKEEPAAQPARTQTRFGATQVIPYLLVASLFFVQVLNVLSTDKTQQSIRPVLLIATILVVCLVITRQIITMLENEQLVKEQADTLAQLEKVYQDIAKRNTELETGINHLKEIQAQLANGNTRARAHIATGKLWPLAVGLNLMADRMMRNERSQATVQHMMQAIADLSIAIERQTPTSPFVLPASCQDIPPIQQLLQVINKKVASR